MNMFWKKIFSLTPRIIIIFAGLCLFFILSFLFKAIFGFWVNARFSELEPMDKSIPVYFKGIKVGMTGKIKNSDDLKYTFVVLKFSKKPKNMPDNITVELNKFPDDGQYFDIIFPKEPSDKPLKKGETIEGKKHPDISSFISEQVGSNAFAEASANMGKITDNTAQLTDELKQIIAKVNKATPEEKISNIVTNAETTSKNISDFTGNIVGITDNVDKATKNLDATFQKLDGAMEGANNAMAGASSVMSGANKTIENTGSVVDNVSCITENVCTITDGVKKTLQKRFGTMRLLFGTPVEKESEGSEAANPCKRGKE